MVDNIYGQILITAVLLVFSVLADCDGIHARPTGRAWLTPGEELLNVFLEQSLVIHLYLKGSISTTVKNNTKPISIYVLRKKNEI